MASAERDPITGVWGEVPSGVQGLSPWSLKWLGGEEGKAPWSWWHFNTQSTFHFLRFSCGIMHWCNGCKFL